ncbi:MAG: hypothetical protein AAFY57_15605 [Cyanobacteria bacterium J06642_2]
MEIYKPSNVVPTSGYVWCLLTALVTGGVVGGTISLIGTFFYLIILFPLGMGVLGAGATQLAIKSGKVRNPRSALVFGVLTGASIYGSMHLIDYVRFQRQVANEFREFYAAELEREIAQNERTEEQVLRDATESLLLEQTGQTGFLGYLKYFAQQGMSLSSGGSGGLPVGGVFMWVYWGLELGVVLGISGLGGLGAAREPFNEKKNEWYGTPTRVGNVPDEVSQQFIELLDKDNYADAGKLVTLSESISVPSIEVYLHQASDDWMDDSILDLSNTSFGRNQEIQRERFLLGSLTRAQWQKFDRAIER